MAEGLLEEAAPGQTMPNEQGGELKVSPQAQAIVDQAVEILYSPGEGNLENMVKMFQQHGPEQFSTAMATAVLGVLERIQQENQGISLEILAEVGGKIFEIILQDIMEGGVIENISESEVLMAQSKILDGWAKSNYSNLSPEDAQNLTQLSQQIAQAAQQSTGQGGEAPPMGGGMPQGAM